MNKSEARNYLKRARVAIREAEAAIASNDEQLLEDALNEGEGALATIHSDLDFDRQGNRPGVGGIK